VRHRERPRYRHHPLRTLVGPAVLLVVRRAHRELSRWNYDHLRTILAVAECVASPKAKRRAVHDHDAGQGIRRSKTFDRRDRAVAFTAASAPRRVIRLDLVSTLLRDDVISLARNRWRQRHDQGLPLILGEQNERIVDEGPVSREELVP